MINLFNFNLPSFYSLNYPFKSSLGVSLIITPIHFFTFVYKEKLRLEKENNQILINQERNKLAGELHDDIGFSLTSAIIQLNLAQKLIKKEKLDCSLNSVETAKSQMKYALENIRLKVRLVRDDFNFKNEFNSLIKTFENLTNINIEIGLDDLINVDDSRKILIYRALKEGINNGIRHGNANYFKFRLIIDQNKILFILKNNGQNDFNKIEKGFGLKNLENKVEKMGGGLKTYIDEQNYFVLKFHIDKKKVAE